MNPEYAGLLLDSRPSAPNKPFQMETQYVPGALSVDEKGETYARVAPTSFPVGPDGNTVVLHRLTSYNKKALWDDVKAWFEGGPAASGAINPAGASVQTFRANGGSTWKIYPERTPKDKKIAMAWNSFATPIAPDPTTYGYKWNEQIREEDQCTTAPASCSRSISAFRTTERRTTGSWPKRSDVPATSGLADVAIRPAQGATARALRHARSSGELVQKARARLPDRSRHTSATAAS